MIPMLDFEDKIRRAMVEISNNTAITNGSRGSTIRTIIEAIGKIEHGYTTAILDMLLRRNLSTASGAELDIIGEILGLSRRSSINASVFASDRVVRFRSSRGTFGNINNDLPIIIPSGTRIVLRTHTEGGSSNIFRTTDQVFCSPEDEYAWVSCSSELSGRPGSIGKNAMFLHDFTGYADYRNQTLLIENLSPITGESVESDDSYRSRLAKEKNRRGGSNYIAIELAALTVPGVQDVRVVPCEAGAGTATCYVMASTGRTGTPLLSKVRMAIDYYEAPIGDIITVSEPEYVGVELETRVKFKESVTAAERRTMLDAATASVMIGIGLLGRGETRSINAITSDITRVIGDSIVDMGSSGKLIDAHWMWNQTRDGRRYRNRILGNYNVRFNERLIIEDSIDNAIRITEWE